MAATPLAQLYDSSLKVLATLESDELYTTCVKEAVSLAGATYGSLFLEKNGQLVRVFSTLPLKYRVNPRAGGNTYQAFAKGMIRHITTTTFKKIHPEAKKHFASVIFIPLAYQDKHLGVISIDSFKDIHYTVELKHSLKLFGSLVTLAIRNIQIYENTQSELKTRELFMSTAAHELKTPLAAIHAYTQLVKKKVQKEETVKEKWVDSILSNSSRLQILMRDLFSTSQIDMGIFNYDFTDCDLLHFLPKLITDISLLHKRKIDFDSKVKTKQASIHADENKLSLVFSNVIGNAIKYSPRDSVIQIVLKPKKDHFILSVTDQGNGIAKEDLPHVFEKFYQGKKNSTTGLGLGMYLCKEVIEAHHGEISIDSTVGQGTTVDIYLPKNV